MSDARISGPPTSNPPTTQSIVPAKSQKSNSIGHNWKQLSTGQKVGVAVAGILTSVLSPVLGGVISFGLIKLLSRNKMSSSSKPFESSAKKTDRQSISHDIQLKKEKKTSSEMTDDFMIMTQRTGGGNKPIALHQEVSTPQQTPLDKMAHKEIMNNQNLFGKIYAFAKNQHQQENIDCLGLVAQ